jgi:predicted nucleotidyltransferase component of viral defense system
MANKEIIDFISKRLGIARRDLIEKDAIITPLLFHLSQNEYFKENFAFKGGTCLIKCYFGYFRFSEDLDFTYIHSGEFEGKSGMKSREIISDKIDKLGEIIEEISKQLNLDFKNDKNNKKYFQFGGSNAFVTFKIWYDSKEQGKETFVKIQVNFIEKLIYPVKELNAMPIVPKSLERDFSFIAKENAKPLLSPIAIRAYDIREILTEKVRAILTRRGIKPRDFVDVFFIAKREKLEIRDLKKEIIEKINYMLKFEKYGINIKNKEAQLDENVVLGEEETLLLSKIEEGFDRFLEEFNVFLKEIILELKEKE